MLIQPFWRGCGGGAPAKKIALLDPQSNHFYEQTMTYHTPMEASQRVASNRAEVRVRGATVLPSGLGL